MTDSCEKKKNTKPIVKRLYTQKQNCFSLWELWDFYSLIERNDFCCVSSGTKERWEEFVSKLTKDNCSHYWNNNSNSSLITLCCDTELDSNTSSHVEKKGKHRGTQNSPWFLFLSTTDVLGNFHALWEFLSNFPNGIYSRDTSLISKLLVFLTHKSTALLGYLYVTLQPKKLRLLLVSALLRSRYKLSNIIHRCIHPHPHPPSPPHSLYQIIKLWISLQEKEQRQNNFKYCLESSIFRRDIATIERNILSS